MIPIPRSRLSSPVTFEPGILLLNFPFTLVSNINLFTFSNLSPPCVLLNRAKERSEGYVLAHLCIDVDSTHPLGHNIDHTGFGGITASHSHFHSVTILL